MTEPCDNLHAYVDGELGEQETAELEVHLVTCARCRAELPRLLALLVALDDAAELAARTRPPATRLTVLSGGQPAEAVAARPARPQRRRWLLVAGPLAAAAAVLLVVLLPRSTTPRPDFGLGSSRPLEARLSYPGTDTYGPQNAQRAAGSAAIASDRLLQLQLAFQQAKDWHGVAVASLLTADRERARQAFARAPSTPEVDADRAVLELMTGTPEALERGLDDVDRALAAAPGNAAAHWNRALVLAAMNLPLAAAREFDGVQALGEPGWSGEARTRAEALRAQVRQRRTHWKQAHDAGPKLIEDGTPVPAELFDVTGIMTITLYDAVRAAPSRDRVLALLPLAGALDRVYGGARLTGYVQRIAASDFAVRKPLAERYREVALGKATPEATAALLANLERTGPDDIRMGAMVFAGKVGSQLDDYRRLAAATGDPWFTLIAENDAAVAEIAQHRPAAAEHRLREAIALGRREHLAYRTIRLESDLIKLHKRDLQLSQAAVEATSAYRDAIAAGEWVLEMSALSDLASIHHNRYAYSLARAYLTELAERADAGLATGSETYASYECPRRLYVYESLANISILQLDPDRARAELGRAPACDLDPSDGDQAVLLLRNALIRSELYRMGHRAEDARLARNSLAALRDLPATVVAGKDAFVAYVEGQLSIQDDPAAGHRALREAITRAGHDSHEYSVKARAYSFSLLALEAGREAAFDRATAVIAEALNVRAPERCALAIAWEAGRHVVAFSDAHGATGGRYLVDRAGALDVAGLVPRDVVDRLRDCDQISVLARAPVLGAGRLLPPELAWSYVLADPGRAAPPAAAASHRLVIANPEPPPELDLPALGPYPAQRDDPHVTVLRGTDATPSRVLLAMQDASVVEFHTHGFLADDLFEASRLVLSPELDRRYALTSEDLAQVRLAAAPLVVLGACHAATSSRSLEGGMGLAEAFLHAGARAVIASPDAVPDRGSYTFFTAVRDRVLGGTAPAVALRDERVRQLAASPDDTWVSGVVVFQ
jgi:hypothetical protein